VTEILQKMEDEGYTSPPEDCEFLYTPRVYGLGQRDNDHISQVDTSCALENPDPNDESEEIDWMEIARQPCVKSSFISWDDVPCPIPYRKRDLRNVNQRNKKRLSQSFLSENIAESKTFVDNIWRISSPVDDSIDTISTPSAVDQIKSSPEEPSYITVEDFIHHLLHLLCGRESQSFIFMKTGPSMMRKFHKNPSTLIYGMTPSSLDNYSQPFIQCGSIFRKLWLVGYQLTQDDVGFGDGSTSDRRTSGAGKRHSAISAVFVAFQRFIGDYLKLYQTVLMLKGTSMNTLTKLSAFIKVFLIVILNTQV